MPSSRSPQPRRPVIVVVSVLLCEPLAAVSRTV